MYVQYVLNPRLFHRQFPTDRGMCCTFNMEEAESMFVQSQYSSRVKEMQAKDMSLAIPAGAIELPDWYKEGNEPVPEAGVRKGLSLILDAHNNLLSPGMKNKHFSPMIWICHSILNQFTGSVTEDFIGFIAVVGDRKQYPLTELKNIRIRPGMPTIFHRPWEN